jgi:hypothetical protein
MKSRLGRYKKIIFPEEDFAYSIHYCHFINEINNQIFVQVYFTYDLYLNQFTEINIQKIEGDLKRANVEVGGSIL